MLNAIGDWLIFSLTFGVGFMLGVMYISGRSKPFYRCRYCRKAHDNQLHETLAGWDWDEED